MEAVALDPRERHDDFLESATSVEADLRPPEVRARSPGERTPLRRAAEACEIDLDEAFRHGVVLSRAAGSAVSFRCRRASSCRCTGCGRGPR